MTLERVARSVLQGICRSCHLRVHTSTFLQLLEDIPLRQNAQSCSTLQAVKYVRAALEPGASDSPPLAWPQECTIAPGVVTVVRSRPAQDPDRGTPNSKLQVKDRTGTWIDVKLREDEVAVFLGRTAQVASCGLLKASTYRLVGELQKGTGHQNLEFHLRARPDADLNLSKQLEAAGHHLPERHEDGMNDLVRKFSAVLTPPNHTPPNRIQGRGRPSVESMEMRTIPSTDLQRRSRKRVSGELPRAPSPVTRSGKVARTSAGLVNKEHRLCSRGADGAGTSMEEDGGELAAEEAQEGAELAEDVLCVTVDGKGANTSRFITLHMIYEATETEVALRTHPKTSLARLFEVFCDTVGANLSTVKFMYNGERLSGSHTCRQLSNLDEAIFVSDVEC
ncbi:hypothetical protein COCSUDRAFT_67552 [Coccomyxa subellipsoidea C-169]|uniref:Rad60/SUMO-like domain-containing protein n=1 Tax=Coccomyxa subellipsoidea (strain C-169) TaxID=574566 RepID=I0YPB9_COCSC|nr:hypothetical protein COCSUDRAFT_67552 [Coccomyxa subellipsoidea C-169]EIE20238.1 hypothetical protein COCSUDRAFT_67552 [Coccomyxa subellipsoidea C-169]|eukprot:XP_005644782.1 hypothetical protein COCSUDRAFT_67552 [Coccomyxa subellipsoidea C-169]